MAGSASKTSDLVYQAALAIMKTQGEGTPYKPIMHASLYLNRRLRARAQRLLRPKLQKWSPEQIAMCVKAGTKTLRQSNPTNRMVVLETLSLLGEKIPIEIFLAALQDSEACVRWTALEQLTEFGKQGHELPLELITPLLNDPNARVRCYALDTLDTQEGVLIDHFIAAMHDTSENVVHTATIILGKRKNIQAIPTLIEHLLYDPDDSLDDYNDYARQAIEELYEHIPLDMVIEAFNNGNERVQINAIALLNMLKERTPVELFLKLLDDKDPKRQSLGIWALSSHLSRIPIEIIVNKFKERNKQVRKIAARVLLQSDIEIPTDLLLPFLDCPENIARITAVRLLGKRMPIEQLLAARHDHKWAVRVAAIEILGTLGEQISLDVFLEVLCDQNLEGRRAAIQALQRCSQWLSHSFFRLSFKPACSPWSSPCDEIAISLYDAYNNLSQMLFFSACRAMVHF